MVLPRRRTAKLAMTVVVFTTLITIPIVTLFATNLITARSQGADETILTTITKVPERESLLARTTDPAVRAQLSSLVQEGKGYSDSMVSQLGAQFGGTPLKLAIVFSATTLLVLACSTAIIGAYHVFMALANQRFLPEFLTLRNDRFGTPHWAIALATIPPILIIIASRGDMTFLGQLFAFGLLGGFCLTSIGLDVVRWKERRFDAMFFLGLMTTACVVVAWVANLYHKPYATVFGGSITVIGICVAVAVRRSGAARPVPPAGLVTNPADLPRNAVLVPVFDEAFGQPEEQMFDYVGAYAHRVAAPVIILYIREIFDVLQMVQEEIEFDPRAAAFVERAEDVLARHGISVSALYETAVEPYQAMDAVRERCRPRLTIMSPHVHSAFIRLLHGNAMKGIKAGRRERILIFPDARTGGELRRVERPRRR